MQISKQGQDLTVIGFDFVD